MKDKARKLGKARKNDMVWGNAPHFKSYYTKKGGEKCKGCFGLGRYEKGKNDKNKKD
jgi:hypothetical protein